VQRATKKEVARRLKSVEGHVRGVSKMLDQGDVTYREVVQQTTAIFSAIKSINMVLLRDFMEERAGRDGVTEETVDDLIKAVERVTK
jgi:DNA-binding FrmR family transcriptional regulator